MTPWNELKDLSKSDFVNEYLEASIGYDTLKKLDESMIHIGTSSEKGTKASPGSFVSISFKSYPFEGLWDILSPDNSF